MEDDSSEFKSKLQASESTTKDGDESISSRSDDEEYGGGGDDGIISVEEMAIAQSRDYEDLFTLGGDDSIIITSAAHVIDDMENAEHVLDFRRFRRIDFEEKLEIIGIDRFRRYRNLEPKKKKRKGRICKYSTCYMFRFPSFLDDLPCLVKGPVLVSLILLAIAFVIIVAALILNKMIDGKGTYDEIATGPESNTTRDFDAPSSFDGFIPPSSSSSHTVSESSSPPPPSDHVSNSHPPSPWDDNGAKEQTNKQDTTADNTSRNEPVNEEPVVNNEHGNEIIDDEQLVNNEQPSIMHSPDQEPTDESYEIPEYKANIFVQGTVPSYPPIFKTQGTNPEAATIATTTGLQPPVPEETRDPNMPFFPWQNDSP